MTYYHAREGRPVAKTKIAVTLHRKLLQQLDPREEKALAEGGHGE
jgi:hypothetical protein